jgi:hypothetical protein
MLGKNLKPEIALKNKQKPVVAAVTILLNGTLSVRCK